jgi:hypothetical protein
MYLRGCSVVLFTGIADMCFWCRGSLLAKAAAANGYRISIQVVMLDLKPSTIQTQETCLPNMTPANFLTQPRFTHKNHDPSFLSLFQSKIQSFMKKVP